MATRIERMEESLKNYEAKIVEITAKIEEEKKALIGKRADAEKKLAEAKAKFDALYGNLEEEDKEEAQEIVGNLFDNKGVN